MSADTRPRPLQSLPELNGVCTHNLNVLARHALKLIAASDPNERLTEATIYKAIIDWAWLELESVEKQLRQSEDEDISRQVSTIRDRLGAADCVDDILALLALRQAGEGAKPGIEAAE